MELAAARLRLGLLRGRVVVAAVALAFLGVAGCASQFPVVPVKPPAGLGPVEILERSIAASGDDPYTTLQDVAVSYEGEWGTVVQALQPALTDGEYRRSSEERVLLASGVVAQIHRGPGGEKRVLRDRAGVQVAYDGAITEDQDVVETSALVADAYTMFLLGPAWLRRNGSEWARLGDAESDGRSFYRVRGRLRPGIGLSAQDDVVAWIDRDTFLLHRVHFTLEGHRYTQGAHADVTFFDYRKVFGRSWPTRFVERVRGPVDIHAHEWWMTGLDVNRGLGRVDLGRPGGENWSAAAATPAATLP